MKKFQTGLKKASKGFGTLLAAAALSALVFTADAAAQKTSGGMTRIKDIVDFEGVRDNMLIGYGLVVGLNGTGDSLNNSPFTKQSLQAMLERLGVNVRDSTMRTANTAAVMVTAKLPAFAAQGTAIDVSVSALGDAKNLRSRHPQAALGFLYVLGANAFETEVETEGDRPFGPNP